MRKTIAMVTVLASAAGFAAATDDIHNTWLAERATHSTQTAQVSQAGYTLSFNTYGGDHIHGYESATQEFGAIQPAAGHGMGTKVSEVLQRSHDGFAN